MIKGWKQRQIKITCVSIFNTLFSVCFEFQHLTRFCSTYSRLWETHNKDIMIQSLLTMMKKSFQEVKMKKEIGGELTEKVRVEKTKTK